MKIAIVCKYGVFRSQVLAALLKNEGIDAETYGLLEDYAGRRVSDIKEFFVVSNLSLE